MGPGSPKRKRGISSLALRAPVVGLYAHAGSWLLLLDRRISTIHVQVFQDLDLPRFGSGPTNLDTVHLGGLAQAEGQRQFALAQVTAGAGHHSFLDLAAAGQGHLGAYGAGVAALAIAFEGEANPVVARAAHVLEEACRAAVLGQHYIEVAVAVDVGISAAPTDHRLEQVRAGKLGADRLKGALASRVPEQLHWLLIALVRLDQLDVRLQ